MRRWSPSRIVLVLLPLACGEDIDAPPGAGTTSSEGTGETTAPAASDSAPADETGAETGEPVHGPWEDGWVIPAGEQAPGDPVAGREALLSNGYVTCGIPYQLFSFVAPLLGSFADAPPLPGRTGKNADMPYNWTVHTVASGAEIVSLNCLECHAGYFNGEVILGLGRADADYTEDFGALLGDLPLPKLPSPGVAELTEMAERYKAVGPHLKMYTVGTNPADKLAAVLGAHRDQETLAWHDEEIPPVPNLVVPVDTPPWWRVAKKNGHFYNGMSRGDHRGTMMFASSLCTDTVEEAQSILDYFDDINAYLHTLEAPKYPFAIDAELAEQGRLTFAGSCAPCHGTYAEDPADESYPNLLLPLDVIGTDPLIAAQAGELPFNDWYNGSFYGEVTPLTPDDPFPGYVAPPLDGIWATAPFLHNASVPNLELVLDSTARPTYWRRVDYDSENFDEEAVGWPFQELPYGQVDAPEDERKHVYDTTFVGHTNGGHTFGDALTPEQRRAVVEYLKTL